MPLTQSEQYLEKLCKRSFLSLWSYSNIFNDCGVTGPRKIGKEICDLLVVFGNDVIIFSDKSCEFKNTGNLKTDWNRWVRKAIKKSSQQLYGAERWLTNFPDRIFLDNTCNIPFPIAMPRGEHVRFHRIAVATGVKQECQTFYGGGSGSLRSNNHEPMEMESDQDTERAFSIGKSDGEYIHVLDDVTLDLVMAELDTIADFIAYLRKKEEVMARYMVYSTGEEELLASYLTNLEEDGTHGFGIPPDATTLFIAEGSWHHLSTHRKYAARAAANRISYLWDRLIEDLTRRCVAGEIVEPVGLESFEIALRCMALLDRFERRLVAKKLSEVLTQTASNQARFSAGCMKNGTLAFAFVLLPPPPGMRYEDYQIARVNVLDAYCHIVKNKHRSIQEIVGIGIEPHHPGRGGSEAIYYTKFTSEWTDDDVAHANANQERLGLSLPQHRYHEVEFPDDTA